MPALHSIAFYVFVVSSLGIWISISNILFRKNLTVISYIVLISMMVIMVSSELIWLR